MLNPPLYDSLGKEITKIPEDLSWEDLKKVKEMEPLLKKIKTVPIERP